MQSQPRQFEQLTIPRRALERTFGLYRVYESPTQSKVVEAATAMEALKACGITSAYKIMREDPLRCNLLSADAWHKEAAVPATETVTEETQAATDAQESPAQE